MNKKCRNFQFSLKFYQTILGIILVCAVLYVLSVNYHGEKFMIIPTAEFSERIYNPNSFHKDIFYANTDDVWEWETRGKEYTIEMAEILYKKTGYQLYVVSLSIEILEAIYVDDVNNVTEEDIDEGVKDYIQKYIDEVITDPYAIILVHVLSKPFHIADEKVGYMDIYEDTFCGSKNPNISYWTGRGIKDGYWFFGSKIMEHMNLDIVEVLQACVEKYSNTNYDYNSPVAKILETFVSHTIYRNFVIMVRIVIVGIFIVVVWQIILQRNRRICL